MHDWVGQIVTLFFASEARDVVLAAVQQNGRALNYASEELQADREVVMAAACSRTARRAYMLRRNCRRICTI